MGYYLPKLAPPFENALMLLFAELASAATEQSQAFLGSPGSLSERTNDNGTRFWVHRYSDPTGRRVETYLGAATDPATDLKTAALRDRIAVANANIERVRILARSGFSTVDRKTYATLASLHNHGLFDAGAMLIGSHAYGALLNALGVRSGGYKTEDIDIARGERLSLAGETSFLEMLRATGIAFGEVPALGHRSPSTSFKERGGSRLRVDLLAPARDSSYPTIAVPELAAHASGQPYLAYLLGTSQELPLLSPFGVLRVRVPTPERLAVHKLIASQLRSRTSAKSDKDVRQAAALIEVMTEKFPGAIQDALQAVPKTARRSLARGVEALRRQLPDYSAAAWEQLTAKI